MRIIWQLVFVLFGGATSASAGKPIILTEAEACSAATTVVIATIQSIEVIPTDQFGSSEWHRFGFTQFVKPKVKVVLLGSVPDDLTIYGGCISGGMTPFRLEIGDYLVLLKRVQDDSGRPIPENVYMAVDWIYSFAPVNEDKVGWLMDKLTGERDWIRFEEVLIRIRSMQQQRTGSRTDR